MIVRTIFQRKAVAATVYTRVSPSTWNADSIIRRTFDTLASPSAEKQVKSCSPRSTEAISFNRATSRPRRTQWRKLRI